MRLLFALTYYRPHISGLTIYVERLATELARRGHTITILTSRYHPHLPQYEQRMGIRIVRIPVLARVSKGVVMPSAWLIASVLTHHHDALSLHLPQFEASGFALIGRLLAKPVVVTYQCDLKMPPGLLHTVANRAIHMSNMVAGTLAHRIVASTEDYADHSPYLTRFRSKQCIIPMPIEVAQVSIEDIAAFRQRWHIAEQPIIGMAARLAAEKGVEVLLHALPHILQHYPKAQVCYVGPYTDIVGEEAYARRLAPLFAQYQAHWTFLGMVSPHDMTAFYTSCDVLVLPSLNATESFGLVQVEAMLCGTPCVASNLPGVRQPILQTGMGKIFPTGNSAALAEALLEVLDNRQRYIQPYASIANRFNTQRTATAYETLFQELLV